MKTTLNNTKTVKSVGSYGDIEYKMSQAMAKHILSTRKGADVNTHPQAFLCKVVNDEFGIKGNCIKVIVE